MTMMYPSEGYVYLITNPNFPGWIKIGHSSDPSRRLDEYQTGDPTRSYRLLDALWVRDRRLVEFLTHERLERLGFARGGEWFKVGLGVARSIIRKAAVEARNYLDASAQW